MKLDIQDLVKQNQTNNTDQDIPLCNAMMLLLNLSADTSETPSTFRFDSVTLEALESRIEFKNCL